MDLEPVKPYRGPPPRRDVVLSPNRLKELKGNDIFNSSNSKDRCDTEASTQPRMNGILSPHEHDERLTTPLRTAREEYSEYSRLALQGGHKDLICGVENGHGNMDSSRRQKKSENISEYNKLALQGGHKGLLNGTDTPDEKAKQRPPKKCDNVSNYNKLCIQGGHKGLLRMDVEEQASPVRKSKGEGELSDYTRLAKQGGHKDLLVIEENKPSPIKKEAQRSGGEWFAHDNNNNSSIKRNSTEKSKPAENHSVKVASQKQSNRSTTEVLPSGQEQALRYGRKPSDQRSQTREAPFATHY